MISFSLVTHYYVYKPIIIILMENSFNSLIILLLRIAHTKRYSTQNKYSSATERTMRSWSLLTNFALFAVIYNNVHLMLVKRNQNYNINYMIWLYRRKVHFVNSTGRFYWKDIRKISVKEKISRYDAICFASPHNRDLYALIKNISRCFPVSVSVQIYPSARDSTVKNAHFLQPVLQSLSFWKHIFL